MARRLVVVTGFVAAAGAALATGACNVKAAAIPNGIAAAAKLRRALRFSGDITFRSREVRANPRGTGTRTCLTRRVAPYIAVR